MRRLGLCLALVIVGCGRTGDTAFSTTAAVADLAGGSTVDLAMGACTCPQPLQCVDGQCCAGMLCTQSCDPAHPCPRGEQCFDGVCVPTAPDLGRRHDMGPRDMSAGLDMRAGSDMRAELDMSQPPPDLARGSDGGMTSGCTNDAQCPGARCDWLTGQCVPIESCNNDRDCPNGAACVAHQCLPIQVCLPFPGFPVCPSGEHCALPPGVCVPDADCGPGIGACPSSERCVGGYCQPDACTSSAQCNDGYDCVNGQCVARRYCGPFERCPRRQHCSAHVCVP